MIKHILNIKYILKHKHFVFIECLKRGLLYRGIVHDMSKFSISEFIAYSNYFYNKDNKKDMHVPGENIEFDNAWLKHIHKNDHHWQYWILKEDEDDVKVLPMSHEARSEMLCDWIGASKALGKGNNTKKWYKTNKNNIILHNDTRKWIEEQIKKL